VCGGGRRAGQRGPQVLAQGTHQPCAAPQPHTAAHTPAHLVRPCRCAAPLLGPLVLVDDGWQLATQRLVVLRVAVAQRHEAHLRDTQHARAGHAAANHTHGATAANVCTCHARCWRVRHARPHLLRHGRGACERGQQRTNELAAVDADRGLAGSSRAAHMGRRCQHVPRTDCKPACVRTHAWRTHARQACARPHLVRCCLVRVVAQRGRARAAHHDQRAPRLAAAAVRAVRRDDQAACRVMRQVPAAQPVVAARFQHVVRGGCSAWNCTPPLHTHTPGQLVQHLQQRHTHAGGAHAARLLRELQQAAHPAQLPHVVVGGHHALRVRGVHNTHPRLAHRDAHVIPPLPSTLPQQRHGTRAAHGARTHLQVDLARHVLGRAPQVGPVTKVPVRRARCVGAHLVQDVH
jgi:hypothetical protein